MSEDILAMEMDLMERFKKLAELKRQQPREHIEENYDLKSVNGVQQFSELFGDRPDLIVIHNMGKSCRYCMMWADGFNGLFDHLNDRAAFVLVSPDEPEVVKEFAESRGWKFPVLSAEGTTFIKDMGFQNESGYMPGVSTFEKTKDGQIQRVAKSFLGPFDQFCSAWHLFALLADGVDEWQPRYKYES